jgi:hypothetical protein
MSVYLAWLIPISVIVVVNVYYRKRVMWWESLIVLLIPILLTMIIKLIGQSSVMYSNEYWNSYGLKAEYYEPWDERVSCRHPIYHTEVSMDFHGNLQTHQVYVGNEHPFDVDYHGPEWRLIGTDNQTLGIPQSKFEELCTRWGNKQLHDMNRHYHSINGNAYFSVWNSTFSDIEPIASMHNYKNKIKTSDSLFRNVDFKLKPYDYKTVNGYMCDYIYGDNNLEDQLLLRQWNALLGAKKKVVMMLIPYYNEPRVNAINQEAFWKGGNKNEFILCVGITNKIIEWVHVISWTPQIVLKEKIEREVLRMEKYDTKSVINYMGNEIQSCDGVMRRDFEEFNSITVPIPTWATVLIYILSILSSVGLAYWAMANEFYERN